MGTTDSADQFNDTAVTPRRMASSAEHSARFSQRTSFSESAFTGPQFALPSRTGKPCPKNRPSGRP